MPELQSMPGTYALVLWLPNATTFPRVGPFGAVSLPAGHYLYLGSAFGSGGVKGRVGHHLRHASHPRWHLDYVRPQMTIIEAWVTYDKVRRECAWSQVVHEALGHHPLVLGFGSADCNRCPAHFYHSATQPSFSDFCQAIKEKNSGHSPVERVVFKPSPQVDDTVDGQAVARQVAEHWRSQLEPAEVAVPDLWREGTDHATLYPGECFYRSYRYISSLSLRVCGARLYDLHRQIWLVHGQMTGCGHAWVELPDNIVFDGAFQRFYHKAPYYETLLIQPWYKYAPHAAVMIAANLPRTPTGLCYYGGWHISLKLPWADPEHPTVIDDRQAIDLLAASGLCPNLAKKPKKHRAKSESRP